MDTRDAVPGDVLVLARYEGRSILVPERGERMEVKVGKGVVAKVDHIETEWKFCLIPCRCRTVEEGTFFYESDTDWYPQVWLAADRKRLSLEKFPPGTRFIITGDRRVFEKIGTVLGGRWQLADMPSR